MDTVVVTSVTRRIHFRPRYIGLRTRVTHAEAQKMVRPGVRRFNKYCC
jgi:hypothetical protein